MSTQKTDPHGYPDFSTPVSIIAQLIDALNVDITAQSVAIKGLTDWAAEQATDIDLTGNRVASSGVFYKLIDYTVPSGKTLLIYNHDGGLMDGDGQLFTYLWNDTTNTYLGFSGGVRGFSTVFSKPIRIPSGHTVHVYATQNTGANRTIWVHIGGVLL